MHPVRRARKQGVVLVVFLAPSALHFGVLCHPPPAKRGLLAFPFGQRDHFAVLGGVALEREVAGLDSGQRLHCIGIGAIGRSIQIGALAVAEDDEEHDAPLAQ